ncbi:hypothetical protein MTR_1g087770 [Medicago truncatula]|uniref:Uncharacterized protein n=1 Tax=Medicago truncatula TaxID=3880 RepID=G7IEI0_MEDTR|nr:hypothetical protein MTR_1g087770 [Medicago truncatula]
MPTTNTNRTLYRIIKQQLHNSLDIHDISTGKCRNCKAGRCDPGSNPGPHSYV